MQHPPGTELEPPTTHYIRVKGHLGERWAAWFDHGTITREPNGETLLAVSIVDQAALHGLLTKIRDLGLTLLSVIEAEAPWVGRLDDDAHTEQHDPNEEGNV
jgi:hypothetical protein